MSNDKRGADYKPDSATQGILDCAGFTPEDRFVNLFDAWLFAARDLGLTKDEVRQFTGDGAGTLGDWPGWLEEQADGV